LKGDELNAESVFILRDKVIEIHSQLASRRIQVFMPKKTLYCDQVAAIFHQVPSAKLVRIKCE
jgi:hypothetical protein